MRLKVITYVFCALAEVCIMVRLWTKIRIVAKLDLDDWVMVVSGVSLHYAALVE